MKNSTSTSNGIKRTVSMGALTVDDVYTAEYQKKGTLTAQLRQDVNVVSIYPSQKIANSKQDNIFAMDDFGFEGQEFTSTESRVAWINVPEGLTKAQVAKKLKDFADAQLYKCLSNHPILTEDQEYSIEAGLKTMEDYANAQVVRYPENHETSPNAIVLDPAGKVQYRKVFFSSVEKEDEDFRTTDPSDFYITPEIELELNPVKKAAPAGRAGRVPAQQI